MSRGNRIGQTHTLPTGNQAEPEMPAGQEQPPESKKYLTDHQGQTEPVPQNKKLSSRIAKRPESAQNLPSAQAFPFHHLQDQITCSHDLAELQGLYPALEDKQFLEEKKLDQKAAKELKQHLQKKLTSLVRAKINTIKTPSDLKMFIDCLPRVLQKPRVKRQFFQYLFHSGHALQSDQKPIGNMMDQCKGSGQTAALLEQLSRLKDQTSDKGYQQHIDETVIQLIDDIFSGNAEKIDLEALRAVYLRHTSDDTRVTPVRDKLAEHIICTGPELLENGDQETIRLIFDICRESARVSQIYVDRLEPFIKFARNCNNNGLLVIRNGITNFGLAVDQLKENEVPDRFRQNRDG